MCKTFTSGEKGQGEGRTGRAGEIHGEGPEGPVGPCTGVPTLVVRAEPPDTLLASRPGTQEPRASALLPCHPKRCFFSPTISFGFPFLYFAKCLEQQGGNKAGLVVLS